MIPLANIRAAHRTKTVNYIAAEPCPARFRTFTLNVRTSEPAKAREFRVGGMDPAVTTIATIALPMAATPPQAETETIDITDFGGETNNYRIIASKPLQGFNCFELTLRSTRATASKLPRTLA